LNYKIEVWHVGGSSAAYTFSPSDLTDAINVQFKNVVTDGVGTFKFVLPSRKGAGNPIYNDIEEHATVKIWLADKTLSTDPNFVGRVTNNIDSASEKFQRDISGLGIGEILLRQHKTNTFWNAVSAHTVVDALCDDLGLGKTLVGAEASPITLQVERERYFDVLSTVSDYWVDAGVQLKKDFYVDVNNNLVWNDRPLRTVGVESLVFDENMVNYTVTKDVTPVKNRITIHGEPGQIGDANGKMDRGRKDPTDGDSNTENSLTGWTAVSGALSLSATNFIIGLKSVTCQNIVGPPYIMDFYLTKTIYTFGADKYLTLNFYSWSAAGTHKVRLAAPDWTNYFETDAVSNGAWPFNRYELCEQFEYDAVKNPTGVWHVGAGSPKWPVLTGVRFYRSDPTAQGIWIDGLYFGHGRWRYSVEDSGAGSSQALCGIRDHSEIVDTLISDAECETRARTRLYQLKDLPKQLSVLLKGNLNVLPGDRVPVTIAPEGISAVNYDVIEVDQSLSITDLAYATTATLVRDENTRDMLPKKPFDLLRGIRTSLVSTSYGHRVTS